MKDKKNNGFICKRCDNLDVTGELDNCPYCGCEDWKRVNIDKCKSCNQWKVVDIKKVINKNGH